MSIMKLTRITTVLLGVSVLMAATSAAAMPCPSAPTEQCQCVPTPVTVPGLTGAPEWKDMDGDGFWRPALHDPRWSGSPFRYLGASSEGALDAMEVAWRAVRHGEYLYVFVETEGTDDTWPGSPLDEIQLGITAGSNSTAYAVNIRLKKGAPIVPPSASVPHDTVFDVDGSPSIYWTSDAAGSFAASTVSPGLPTWVEHPAVWEFPVTGGHRWAFTARLNLGPSGANALGGDLRLFVAARVVKSMGEVTFANVPPIAQILDGVGSTSNIPTNTSAWQRVAQIGTACVGGITVSSMDVGVLPAPLGASPSTSLTHRICASDPCPPETPGGNPENIFRVTARGLLPGAAQWRVRTRLRIADWGSTIADRRNGAWTDVTVPAGPAVFNAPPGAFAAGTGWHWQHTSVGGKDDATIDFQCDKGSNAYCPMLTTPSPSTHQCLLVELGLPDGSNNEISTAAVYRNLDFVGLSELNRVAKIDLKGLTASSGAAGDRDVYLYVETLNMPPHGREPLWLPAEEMARVRDIARNPPRVPRLEGPEAKLEDAMAMEHLGREQAAARRAQMTKEAAHFGRLLRTETKVGGVHPSSLATMSQSAILETVWPTYKVRPYIDTGKTNTQDGKTTKIMSPMVPFGFYLSHDGPFYGFEHALTAADPSVEVTKISDNWYKLRIPNEGAALVQTRIVAAEEPASSGSAHCEKCERELAACRADKKGRCGCRYPGERYDSPLALAFGALLAGALFLRRRRAVA